MGREMMITVNLRNSGSLLEIFLPEQGQRRKRWQGQENVKEEWEKEKGGKEDILV
jgi:hypothetical protein